MTALVLELRIVYGVTDAERPSLPAVAQPGPVPAVTWDAVRTIAELVRQHLPSDVTTAYLLAEARLVSGSAALGV